MRRSKSHDGYTADVVLKRDVFSETSKGTYHGRKAALRDLSKVPWYGWMISQMLARREVKGLRAVQGITGVPELIAADRHGILRGWSEGTPLHLVKPTDPAWYRDASRLLRAMRQRGVTHNDIAKPQNWLVRDDGLAGVIDFQLASVSQFRGPLFRLAAREDLRHLLKQQSNFAPHLLTPTGWRLVRRKSLPNRLWMATGKRLYNFITRRLMNWSDGEGFENIIHTHGANLERAFRDAGAQDVALSSYPAGGGLGIYAFVVGTDTAPATNPRVNLVQQVNKLPRKSDGEVWTEVLDLIAMNRVDEAQHLAKSAPEQADIVDQIIAKRLNLTDRK